MPLRDYLNNYHFDANTFDFEAFKADAIREFDGDSTAWSAKVDQLTEQQKTLAAENQAVKAKNWDLFNKLPAEQPKEISGEGGAEPESAPTIDSFFGKE